MQLFVHLLLTLLLGHVVPTTAQADWVGVQESLSAGRALLLEGIASQAASVACEQCEWDEEEEEREDDDCSSARSTSVSPTHAKHRPFPCREQNCSRPWRERQLARAPPVR